MKLSNNILQPSTGDLVGFSGEKVPVMGSVWLQTTLGEDNTIATIHSDAREARECYNSFKRPNQHMQAHVNNISNQEDLTTLADLDPRAGTLERPTLTEDLHKIYFVDSSDMFTYVGSTLSSEEKASFRSFLQQNAYLFAWTPTDMPGIDPSIISHKLALDPSVRPIAQKKQNLGHDRKQASLEETKKLINAGFIQEIRFTTWMANVVMIGRNIEVYVDDMVAKTKIGNSHLDDLAEIFGQIRKYNMRLNHEKCAFGVQSGKFLDFILTSRGIENAELQYPSIGKLDLALVFSARRLQPYFQSHIIHVWINHHLRQVLHKPELAGQLVKWSVELSEFDIKYEGLSSIKSQFLADFIAEFSALDTAEDYVEWSLYVDGSSNPQGCGAGIIIDDSQNNVIEHSLQFFSKQHIPWESNGRADILSKLASTQPNESSLYQSTLLKPSIELTEILSVTQDTDWRTPYISYLRTGVVPDNIQNPRHFRRQASSFTIYDNCLYRQGFARPLLKCLNMSEANITLSEAHEGICGAHLGAQSLCSKILRAGFYWPTLQKDCKTKVRNCDNCQRHSPITHLPVELLHNSEDLKIKQQFSSIEHPQTNGLAEVANKVILHALRKKLDDAKGLWAELIPEIIWRYNTTIHSTTKETPFRLVYSSDAMIPVEISQSSLRTQLADHTTAESNRHTDLDLVEEIRSSAAITHRAMQQHIARRYNKKSHPRSFQVNDLVLRRT
ncbi:uncharacterized protein [Arachis hypogaea]|uniref:uncharacterized protein n=1 Tax=Arachis hypogaea TaxID=3818 RepID=UPI003B21599D